VVQQRGTVQLKGGIGEAGDTYERHADAVADRIVKGVPAGDLLDQVASPRAGTSASGVQRLQLALDGDLRTAVNAHPVDAARVIALIDARLSPRWWPSPTTPRSCTRSSRTCPRRMPCAHAWPAASSSTGTSRCWRGR
jgi:hypothetical protein